MRRLANGDWELDDAETADAMRLSGQLRPVIGEPLMLVREYGNRFDARAVQVWAREKHVGYIAAKQNKDLSMAMDACASEPGQPVSWTERAVLHNRDNKWPLVEVAEEPK